MAEMVHTVTESVRPRRNTVRREPHFQIKPIFDALEVASVEYCLLRGQDELHDDANNLEIDLLVHPSRFRALAGVAAKLGFVEWPAWGHFPHKFFLTYDEPHGRWIKLDVVTALYYGNPIRRYRVDLVESCLQSRRKELVYQLAPVHEFLTLFLHGLIDKAKIRESQRQRLKELRRVIEQDEALVQQVSAYIDELCSPFVDWHYVKRVLAEEKWESLLKHRVGITRRFFFNQPVISFTRSLLTRTIRKCRPLFFALFRRGISVALLAPDGAGKSTLAAALQQDLFLRARLIYMGTNLRASNLNLPTTKWFKAKIKSPEFERLGLFKIIIKALNYLNRLAEQWFRLLVSKAYRLKGRIVVYDRYVYDSYLATKTNKIGKKLRRWLLRSMYPHPDLVVLLDAPGELLFRRKGEHSPEVLERQREVFLSLQDKIPNMVVVDASLTAAEVQQQVTAAIWKRYCERFAQ